MGKYILKRLLLMIPIVLIVTFIVFFILNLNSNSIVYTIVGNHATPEIIEEAIHKYGLDKPILVRFYNYMKNIIIYQDFGKSYNFGRPVWDDIVAKVPVSMIVAFNGMLVAALIGIPVGILSAVKQYSMLDRICTTVSMFMAAIPAFWLCMMLVLFFSVTLRIFPTSGNDTWLHYVLPAFGLGLPYAAQEMRYTRTAVLETIRQEYVDTARSKGVPEKKVVWKHALKNAMLPVITVTGANFGGLIGGAVVTETLFVLPGLGSFLMQGINKRDVPMVCGSIFVLSLLYSVIMLCIDLLHALIDPRVKARYAKKG